MSLGRLPRSASSRCRARSPAPARRSSRSAPTPSRSARPTQLDGVDAPGHPRRRVDHDVDAARRSRAARAAGASACAAGMPAFGTCAGMILLATRGARRPRRPALPRRDRHRRAPQRLRPPGRLVRGRPRRRRPATSRRSARCSSGPRSSRRSAPGVEVLARIDGHPVLCRQGAIMVSIVPPGAGRRPAAARAVPEPLGMVGAFEPTDERGATCPATPSGPRSSTRRAPPTPSAASCSPS